MYLGPLSTCRINAKSKENGDSNQRNKSVCLYINTDILFENFLASVFSSTYQFIPKFFSLIVSYDDFGGYEIM